MQPARRKAMTKRDLVHLVGAPQAGHPMLYQRVSARLANKDPELQSLFWMLREGVIGRSHFQQLLASSLRD
jgi:hypothetical protein